MSERLVEYLTDDRDLVMMKNQKGLFGIYSLVRQIQVVDFRWSQYRRLNRDILLCWVGKKQEVISISTLMSVLGQPIKGEIVGWCHFVTLAGLVGSINLHVNKITNYMIVKGG